MQYIFFIYVGNGHLKILGGNESSKMGRQSGLPPGAHFACKCIAFIASAVVMCSHYAFPHLIYFILLSLFEKSLQQYNHVVIYTLEVDLLLAKCRNGFVGFINQLQFSCIWDFRVGLSGYLLAHNRNRRCGQDGDSCGYLATF